MTRAPALPQPKRKRKHRPKRVDLDACIYALGKEALGSLMISTEATSGPLKDGWREATLSEKIDHALLALGIDPEKPWDMQHDPPLGIRPFNPAIDDYEPAENDPRFMRPMQKADHAEETKTVDRPAIDKTRRNAKKQAKHAAAMQPDEEIDAIKKKISRGWPKGRKLQSRNTFEKR